MACTAIYGVYVLMVDNVTYISLVIVMLYYVVKCTLFIHPIYSECCFYLLLFLNVVYILYTTLYRHVSYHHTIDICGKCNFRDNDAY